MKFISVLALFALSTPTWANQGGCPGGSEKVVLNFDRLPDGTQTTAGGFVTDQWEDLGVIFSGRRKSHKGERFVNTQPMLRLFDSSKPTGGDTDLGSPNNECYECYYSNEPCPGVSGDHPNLAADSNCANQNRILIIDSGKGGQPNDNRWGGEIIVDFVERPTKILSFSVMDVEDPSGSYHESYYEIFSSNGQLKKHDYIVTTGDNGWAAQNVNFRHNNIGSIRFDVDQGFALTHLIYCMPIHYY